MDVRGEDSARIRTTVKLWERYILRVVIVSAPVSNVGSLIAIILLDKDISSQLVSVLFFSFCLFAVCLLLVLNRICDVKRKSYAVGRELENLFDTDQEIENEMDESPFYTLSSTNYAKSLYNLVYKNPLEFSKFRPAYGILLLCGYLCLAGAMLLEVLASAGLDKDDAYFAAKVLKYTGVALIVSISFLANSGLYAVEQEPDYYSPFEHFVQIPMKVMVGKTVAGFLLSTAMHLIMGLGMIVTSLLIIISSNYLYRASEETLRFVFPNEIPNQRNFLAFVLMMAAFSCVVVLFGMALSSWAEVRRSILGTIEKNWERNMTAIEFLLQGMEFESLEQIKQALYQKRDQPRLTPDERAAFEYIDIPIWMTKRPFRGTWSAPELPPEFTAPDPEEPDDHSGEQIAAQAEVHQDAPASSAGYQILTRRQSRSLAASQSRTPAAAQQSSSRGYTPRRIRTRRTTEIHDRSDLRE